MTCCWSWAEGRRQHARLPSRSAGSTWRPRNRLRILDRTSNDPLGNRYSVDSAHAWTHSRVLWRRRPHATVLRALASTLLPRTRSRRLSHLARESVSNLKVEL